MSKIIGNTTATPNPQANWTQTDSTKADYIKNKPTIPTVPTNVSAFNNDVGYLTDVPEEIYVGDGYMPEGATIQLIMDGVNEEQALKDELKDYIGGELAVELAKREQLKPEFAQTIDECTDTTKLYVLPDGYIYGYIYTVKTTGGYTNLAEPLPNNTTDKTKWVNGYRFSSSGISAQTGTTLSNAIACKKGDVIRVKGVTLTENSHRVAVDITPSGGTTITDYQYFNAGLSGAWACNGIGEDGAYTFTIDADYSGTITNFRFAMPTPSDASQVIITVNEEIKEATIIKDYAWANTGHAFVPNDYDEEFTTINEDINKIKEDIVNIESESQTLEQSIGALKSEIENIEGIKIPDYWSQHLNEKITAIKNLHRQYGRGCFSFVFMTDTHYPANLGKISPALAKKIMNETNIKFVLHAGDAQTRSCYSTKEEILAENEDIQSMFEPVFDRMLFVEGNHDGSYGIVNGVTYAKQLNENEMFAEYYHSVGLVGDVHFADGCNAYYIDDTANNVRYIGLNSQCVPNSSDDINTDGSAAYHKFSKVKFMQGQFDFLINEALTKGLTDKWKVVIFAHIYIWKDNGGDYSLMVDLLSAYQNKTTYSGSYGGDYGNDAVSVNADFTNAKGKLVGYFSGHNHLDTVQTPSSAFKVITTRCDAKEENDSTLNAERVEGTITEQSFDVFTVTSDKIYATKIGAGADREISY